MTTLVFLLGFLAIAAVGFAISLSRMARQVGRRTEAPLRAAPPGSYEPMTRLFDSRDLQFLQSQKGYQAGMETRLRLERRAALSLYLRHARADFRRSWDVYRSIAPQRESSRFAGEALNQLITFYGLYAALQVQCLLGWLVYVRVDAGNLLAVMQRLRARAGQAVRQEAANWPEATSR